MRIGTVTVIVLLATMGAAQTSVPTPEPLGKIELIALLSSGSSSGLLKQIDQRGINFDVDQTFLQTLADVGAGDEVVSALKSAKPINVAHLSTQEAARESIVIQHLVRANQVNPNRIHYREAEPEYRAAVQADPGNPFTHFALGSVLTRLGRHEDAAAEFQEALHLRPDWAKAHLGLGKELLSENKVDEAIIEIKEAMRLEPESSEPHYDLATALDRQGDKEEAVEQRRIGKSLTLVSLPPGSPLRIRLGGQVEAAKLLYHPNPEYPGEAKKRHVEGTVRLTIIIDKNGTVKDWEVESGDPLLVSAALDSIRQWRYQPTTLNKIPVEVVSEVSINFTLTH